MIFTCCLNDKQEKDEWSGKIVSLENFGSHYQMRIESRSGLTVLFGETTFGNFACIPDFNAGCHLATFDDIFYNTERLSYVLNPVDGITVAKALKVISDSLKKQGDL